MTGQPRQQVRLRGRVVGWAVAGVVALTMAVAACSSDDSADTTSTTTTSPSAPTTPTVPSSGAGGDGPLSVAWVTQLGGPGNDSVNAATGRDDTVVAVGSTQGIPPAAPVPAGVTRGLVATLDAATGTVSATSEVGTDGSTVARSVASAATTGQTLMCGSTDGELGGQSSGTEDAWCAQITPAGTADAAVRSGGDAADRLDAVAITPEGDRAYAAGSTESLFPGAQDPTGGFLGEGDALVVTLDQGGAPGWARQFGTSGADAAEGLTTSDDGDAIVTGSTDGVTDSGSRGGSDGWISRMDPYGNQRWLTQFGSSAADRARAVGVGGDPRRGTETFVATGSTAGTVDGAADATNAGAEDALAAAFNASGKQVWASQFGSTGLDVGTGVVLDGATVYVAGTSDAPIDDSERIPLTPVPPSGDGTAPSTTTTVPPTTAAVPTGRDGFLAALDATTGEVLWVAMFGSAGDEDVTGLTRTETGLLVLSGVTTGQVGATPSAGGSDGFLVAFPLPSAGGGAASAV